MSKKMKFIGSTVLASSLLFTGFVQDTHAEVKSGNDLNSNDKLSKESVEKIEKTLGSFELNQPGIQEKTINLGNNKTAVVGLEYTPTVSNSKDGMLRAASLQNGKYRAYWTTGVFNCEFRFIVSNNKITKAYDGTYSGIGVSVKSANLKLDSSKQATYYFEFGTPVWDFGGWNGWLRAKIDSNNKISYTIK